MYKILLSWRYLRTRFIALASIISVTLGVATLIVVNSVMSGFVEQMKSRLHGILSDVEISAPLLGEIKSPELFVQEVKRVVGDDLQALTCVVRTPGMLTAKVNTDFRDRPMTQQVILLGIDDESFGKVTDFHPYLQNQLKRERFNFELETSGYEDSLNFPDGWEHRRRWVELERFKKGIESGYQEIHQSLAKQYDLPEVASDAAEKFLPPLPDQAPDVDQLEESLFAQATTGEDWPETLSVSPFDPHSKMRPAICEEDMFDPMRQQHTGIILGVALSKRKTFDQNDQLRDFYLIRPGEDVQIMIPTVGANAQATVERCTVVDFYASNMHEYDSMFAFMPLSALQKLRGMIDPLTGQGSVSTIQIKLKPGVELNAVRDRLLQAFPVEYYDFDIHTWLDTQAPLLSAVQMELKILNILLFLIIAVAGFGILATFYMIVVEKTKDIGILKALGAPGSGIMSIFLGYGFSLGMLGTGAGIGLGLLLATHINEIADFVEYLTGREVFDPTIYYFSEIPTLISPWMVASVAIGAVTIAVLASVLPALRAARLHPVEALRYE
jgi:lipoprotein-releasing system permease protein